ncbi:beta-glucosidase Psu2 [Schizosaccharomyces japonicus yFS275]|uniref:Beta-glucosidase Psu2 n=1 Tax=Schizosaccharomyces japonicus (strain yFS275 / FY16936) TaxID=402676 RepID=B6K0T5_SCHJY|nr:beta-glucosidase Psu2 [Schizosaccharomyces japonicus yFS275]EEB07556.2 beta-glucosidase Psu2 [Schizosaccharomyces japonicus yFS275]
MQNCKLDVAIATKNKINNELLEVGREGFRYIRSGIHSTKPYPSFFGDHQFILFQVFHSLVSTCRSFKMLSNILFSLFAIAPLCASAMPMGNHARSSKHGHVHVAETAKKSAYNVTAAIDEAIAALGDTSSKIRVARDGGFENGVYDCSDFPEDQDGVVRLDYLGFGGWTGVQKNDGAYGTAETCQDNTYCSYACKPGMSKTQWPSDQPSNGVSVGGLLCKDGKLYLTQNGTSSLCKSDDDSAYVKNTLGEGVAICRTDYPGTENMVVPTFIDGGSQQPLSVVDSSSYYTWKGGETSAQYYVNKKGKTAEEACVWGNEGDDYGNWAPMNFGSGLKDGKTWISMFINPLATSTLDYNIRVKSDGGELSSECYYEDGEFHNADSSDGCTVAVTGGSAYFEFY